MIVIPAIDIADGKCVRLRQGDMAQRTIFSNDPAQTAMTHTSVTWARAIRR